MSNSAAKVGEIFTEAGAAFNKLAEMTMMLHPMADSPAGSQIRTTLKKKAFEDAGIPVRPLAPAPAPAPTSQLASPHPHPSQQVQHQTASAPHTVLGKSAEVTLNMLNASESEVDVEGLGSEVKLEFEASNEEVTT